MSKIYVYTADRFPQTADGDLVCVALAEDGTTLASHVSSNAGFARRDMGVDSIRKHDRYQKHYPEGYEVVDLIELSEEELDKHEDFLAVYRLHKMKSLEQEKD